MGYHILNADGAITGWTETPFEPAEGQRLVDEPERQTPQTVYQHLKR